MKNARTPRFLVILSGGETASFVSLEAAEQFVAPLTRDWVIRDATEGVWNESLIRKGPAAQCAPNDPFANE